MTGASKDASAPGSGPALDRTLRIGRGAFLGFLMKRLGNRADAEDVLQEFCIRVLARKDQLRDAERMDAWLYAVLRSALNDHYRKAGRRRRLSDAVALEMKSAEQAEEPAEDMAVICRCVNGLVGELRPSDADLIRRIDIDEDDRATVAADLGLRPGTLNVRLHRARAALGEALLAHCGPCCRHGFEDCSCPPAGCEHPVEGTDCVNRPSH
ncbi:RNA polymerase sigma-70 factor, ECF subfamily [Paracoccus halophilus]|uniref:RNA polymerase sigma-70 factor, ECF subfamily n=1 Tax=Paracoccus halophilus TaxID=376733 RepID=A0A099F3D4_9RHOB|nr:sigma-70 family RNA polymerase sigma factor [Paracoccus halophilus]KGJ04914.1 RNA polymerase sigma70 [Paracoccus halophilus]SFA39073.1 RNA polymerase sigma-70 factor, ECF subfamily [Paracoccus halophilus]